MEYDSRYFHLEKFAWKIAAITKYTPALHFSRNAIMGPAMTYPNRAESSRRVGRHEGEKRRLVRGGGGADPIHESRVVKPPTHRLTRPTALPPDDPNLPHVRLAWGGLRAGAARGWGSRGATATKRHPSCHRDTLLPRPNPSDSAVTLLPLGNPRHPRPSHVSSLGCRGRRSRERNACFPRLFLCPIERTDGGQFEENIFKCVYFIAENLWKVRNFSKFSPTFSNLLLPERALTLSVLISKAIGLSEMFKISIQHPLCLLNTLTAKEVRGNRGWPLRSFPPFFPSLPFPRSVRRVIRSNRVVR